MSEPFVKVIIFSVVALFVAASLLWRKPVSDSGRLSLKLCLVNALGWLLILPLSGGGHPPPFLFPTLLFWLVNLVLLPAAAAALRVCYRRREERASYLAVAMAYVAMNAVLLFVVPAVWLIVEVSR